MTTPVQNLARTTTRPVALHGETIPADRKVMLLYGAANRDEREFGLDAEHLDVRRDVKRMLSFGYGAHHCLGAAAARLQAGVALERLLDRFPGFVVDAARPAGSRPARTFGVTNHSRSRRSADHARLALERVAARALRPADR